MAPRKRTDISPSDEQQAAIATEVPTEVKQKAVRRGVFVPLTEFGAIDHARVRDVNKDVMEQVRVAMAREGSSTAIEGEVQIISEDNVKWALKRYMDGCAYAAPAFLRSRSKGAIDIPRELAQQVYRLSDEQLEELAPDGAKFANQQFENLPQWIKDWFLAIGPGAKFFGQLAFITAMQTQTLVAEWQKLHPQPEQPVNGAPAEPSVQ